MTRRIPLLLVEDNPTDRLVIREFLSEAVEVDFELDEVETMAQCLAQLATKEYAAILLDLGLPDSQGELSFRNIIERAPDVPVLVLTGLEDEEAGVRAMRYGAQDYLVKGDFQGSLLIRSVRYAVERHRISSELRQLASKLGDTSRQLGESEARIRELFNVSEDAMIVVDEQNIVQFANPATSRFLMEELGEILGRPFPFQLDKDLSVRELSLPSKQGVVRYAEVKTVQTNWNDQPARLLTLRDITERKNSEQELLLFRQLVDHSDENFEVIDAATGQIIDCNQTCCERLGYTREEMLGLHVWDYDYELTSENWEGQAQRIIREKGARFVSAHVTKTGEKLPVEVSVVHVVMWGRDFFVAVVHDITERLAIEKQLRRDAEILSRIEDAIITLDLDWNILYWSQGAVHLLGWSPDEQVGKNFVSIFDEGEQAEIEGRLCLALKGQIQLVERELTVKCGKRIWVEWTFHVIRDDAGIATGLMLIMRNIEERRNLEAQLRQAQKMEAIGTLAGGIAHDFNNIMAAVRGYTELAHRRSKEESVRRDLNTVLNASQRAAALIEKILTFSRKQSEARAPIRIQEAANESIHLLRATLPATIQIETNIDEFAPSVLANQEQIQQIILNLGTNALHAMSNRAGVLSISLICQKIGSEVSWQHLHLQPGDYVRLSVGDSGCGMSPDTIERIFEPFFTTKEPGEGTGLGLAMVHGIMESHDGAISVESELGEGTTFHLYFPVHGVSVDDLNLEETEEPVGHGEHILFIDDEKLLAQLGKQALEVLGYEVTISYDPKEALQLLLDPQKVFDLVITDQTMPGMTGLELAKAVLRHKPDQRIVISTGYSATLTPAIVREAGILDMLHKPVSINSLSNVVHKALANTDP